MKRGFTLLEMMMVVVVIGILVVIAVPNYQKAVELERWRAARDLLMTIYYGQRTHFFASNAGTYCDVTGPLAANCCAAPPCWNEIHMDNPNLASVPITFTATTDAAFKTFTGVAQHAPGGRCNNAFMQIDDTQPATIKNTGGWGTDTKCQCC